MHYENQMISFMQPYGYARRKLYTRRVHIHATGATCGHKIWTQSQCQALHWFQTCMHIREVEYRGNYAMYTEK
jgi:hypothetical protein